MDRRLLWIFYLLFGLIASSCNAMGQWRTLPVVPTAFELERMGASQPAQATSTVTPVQFTRSPSAVDEPIASPTEPMNLTVVHTPEAKVNTILTATVVPCNRAQAGRPLDVTVPDDTAFRGGEPLTKTWRLVNVGSCTWDRSYALVWFSGADQMSHPPVVLRDLVLPGQAVDLSVDLVAPQIPGTYQSNWKLLSGSGELFGIGPGAAAPFWVRLIVLPEDTPTPLPPTPTLVVTPKPEIYRSGSVTMMITDRFDLDAGLLNPDANGDVSLEWPEDSDAALLLLDGTRFSNALMVDAPDAAQCSTEILHEDALMMDETWIDKYLCYRSGQGLPGFVQWTAFNAEDHSISFMFVTWTAP